LSAPLDDFRDCAYSRESRHIYERAVAVKAHIQ
jgi:hypothetical protein